MRPFFVVLVLVCCSIACCSMAAAQTIELAGPAIGMMPQTVDRVRVAGTAIESLAVWSTGALHAARADLSGGPIDERSLEIESAYVNTFEVATDGRDYLVAYSTCPDSSGSGCEIRFATISPDGFVFHSRQRIAGASVESLAWTGDAYVLAFRPADRAPFPSKLAILDRRGFVFAEQSSFGGANGYYVDLAADGSGGVVLAWATPFGSYFAIATLDDIRRGTIQRVPLANTWAPFTVAVSASGYVINGWNGFDNAQTVLLSRSGIVTSSTTSQVAHDEYRVGATSTTRFAVFTEPSPGQYDLGLRMQPLDRAGAAVPVVPGINDRVFGVDIATTSDGGAVLGWAQPIHEDATEVRIVRVAANGTLVPSRLQPVNRGYVRYDAPDVRRCGDTFVAAWTERSDRKSVRYRRITSAGVPLDPPSRRATAESPNDQYLPRIACTGDAMLITWLEKPPVTAPPRTEIARGLLFAAGGERLIEFGPAHDVLAAAIGNELVVVRGVEDGWYEASHWSGNGTQRTPWTRLFNQQQADCYSDPRGAIESNGDQLMIANVNFCPRRSSHYFVAARPFSGELMLLRTPVTFESDFVGNTLDIAAAPDGWLVAWEGEGVRFGRIDRLFLGLDPSSGISTGGRWPVSAAWNGCTFEIFGPDTITTAAMSGVPTTVPAPSVEERVATDGAGRRFVVTTERDDDGAMHVVGRFEDSPRCVR